MALSGGGGLANFSETLQAGQVTRNSDILCFLPGVTTGRRVIVVVLLANPRFPAPENEGASRSGNAAQRRIISEKSAPAGRGPLKDQGGPASALDRSARSE